MPVSSTSFKPGNSGNPGGRRKDPEAFAAFRERCRAMEPEALTALAQKIAEGDMRAVELVLAYAWGKPPQPQTGEGGEGPISLAGKFEVVFVRPGDPPNPVDVP